MSNKKKHISEPRNFDECREWVSGISNAIGMIAAVNYDLNEVITNAKEKATQEATAYQEELTELVLGLRNYANAHRSELTRNDEVKTIETPAGSFGWRTTPPSVDIDDEETVLDLLLKNPKFSSFVRVVRTVNREGMLADPELATTIKGVDIRQREDFFVRTGEEEVAIAPQGRKPKIEHPKKSEKKARA